MTPLLDWTGHVLVDVGIAGLCAMADKSNPRDLTMEDLDSAAQDMRRYYFSGAMTGYLTCVFMNSEYVQPGSGDKKEQSRHEYSERILFAHRRPPEPAAEGLRCAFSGQPATHLVHRGQIPMITGEGVLNFFPAATGGLAVAGPYLTAIQVLPLAGRRSEGKLLAVHSDDPELTLAFAQRYLEDNRRLLNAAGDWPAADGPHSSLLREQGAYDAQRKRPKMPDAKAPGTLITADLADILREKIGAEYDTAMPCSVTAYWLSSSGQGPSAQMFTVPSQMVGFLRLVQRESTRRAWNFVVNSGWPQPEKPADGVHKKGKKKLVKQVQSVINGPGITRNTALQNLFGIFANGSIDVEAARGFLLRRILPAIEANSTDRADWTLVELFLKEVLSMSPERIEAIRTFSAKLAAFVVARNNKRFLTNLLLARKPFEFRSVLVRAQRREYLENQELLFSLQDYLSVFEADDAVGASDWGLTRDLVSIGLIDNLKSLGYQAEIPADELAKEDEAQPVIA
jgi:CRISPR-associated protein Cst1